MQLACMLCAFPCIPLIPQMKSWRGHCASGSCIRLTTQDQNQVLMHAKAVQCKVNTYLYTGRGDCRVHSQKTAGYSIKHSMASPVRYTPMYAARAAIVLARFSVLQMLEAIRDAMPAGDTKMIAVTCALHPNNVLDSFASNRRMGLDSASTIAVHGMCASVSG